MTHLVDLILRLAQGIEALPERQRQRHAAFLRHAQQKDGGFAGRQGLSDLYYTAFAVRALVLLGQFDELVASRVAEYLCAQPLRRLATIDFISALHVAGMLKFIAGLDVSEKWELSPRALAVEYFQQLRCPDGGYVRNSRGHQSSTYITFLVVTCQQMLDIPLAESMRTVELVRSRQRPDGGFVETDLARHGGTNPTAAAASLLGLLDARDERTSAAVTTFLANLQAPDGGLRANGRIPVADLLSTFTGLAVLDELEPTVAINRDAMQRFVESLECPDGGFCAGVWDTEVDVEYAFYGLGTLALLAGG